MNKANPKLFRSAALGYSELCDVLYMERACLHHWEYYGMAGLPVPEKPIVRTLESEEFS